MADILCSTGALLGRPNGGNYRLLSDHSARLCFDGFELMVFSRWYPELTEFLIFMDSLGLNIPVLHCEKGIGEDISIGGENLENAIVRFETNCGIARELGAKSAVLHLWGGLPSDQIFENNLSAYPRLREISEKYGIDLLVENVVCNCKDPFSRWGEIIESYPDAHFIFDTKMAEFHSQTELLYDEKFGYLWDKSLIRHFHLNDYDGGHMDWSRLRTLPIGSGHVDFERFFAYLKQKGYDGTFTVESTAYDSEGKIDFDMLNRQYEIIKNAIK